MSLMFTNDPYTEDPLRKFMRTVFRNVYFSLFTLIKSLIDSQSIHSQALGEDMYTGPMLSGGMMGAPLLTDQRKHDNFRMPLDVFGNL